MQALSGKQVRKSWADNMVKKVFASLLVSVSFAIVYYAAIYGGFYSDLTGNIGRRAVYIVHKNKRGFWKKFTLWYFRENINKWRYAMFWINLVASLVALILFNVCIWWESALWALKGLKASCAAILITATLGTNYVHRFSSWLDRNFPRPSKRKKRDK